MPKFNSFWQFTETTYREWTNVCQTVVRRSVISQLDNDSLGDWNAWLYPKTLMVTMLAGDRKTKYDEPKVYLGRQKFALMPEWQVFERLTNNCAALFDAGSSSEFHHVPRDARTVDALFRTRYSKGHVLPSATRSFSWITYCFSNSWSGLTREVTSLSRVLRGAITRRCRPRTLPSNTLLLIPKPSVISGFEL